MFKEFIFADFSASPELVVNMSATLQWVENSVPGGGSGVGTSLALRRIGQSYSCSLSVYTAGGHFNGYGLFSDPQGAFDEAVSRLMVFLAA